MTPRPVHLLIVLIVVHIALLAHGASIHFPSRNEVAHLPAGLAVWDSGAFSLYRVNPPLPRAVATLPVMLAGPNTAALGAAADPVRRAEWAVARRFADDNPLVYLTYVRLARGAGIGWSVLGAWLVWRWASELYGEPGGLVSAAVWCLGPTVNAHAQMVTPDLPAAVLALAATYTYRRYLASGSWAAAAGAGVVLGLAQLCKFTLLILYPVWAAVAVAWWFAAPRAGTRRQTALIRLGQLGLLVGCSLLVIDAGYLGTGIGTRLGDCQFVSRVLAGNLPAGAASGNRFRGTWAADIPLPLPTDYVSGIDVQRRDFESGWPSFLAGGWRQQGCWYYYLYALAVKTPAGVLGLAGLAVALTLTRPPTRAAEAITVWLPCVAILSLVSSQTGINSHSRYVLPALPFAVVGIGAVGVRPAGRWRAGLVCVLGVWAAVDVGRTYPHTLSYFNDVSGGPGRGRTHLLNSNIDWGQDLLLLKLWVDDNPTDGPVSIGCRHLIDYRHGGFELDPAPTDPEPGVPPSDRVGPRAGTFAIDVHSLTEGEYQYFQRFRPAESVGHSILIYRITPAEAEQARRAMGLPPIGQPE